MKYFYSHYERNNLPKCYCVPFSINLIKIYLKNLQAIQQYHPSTCIFITYIIYIVTNGKKNNIGD